MLIATRAITPAPTVTRYVINYAAWMADGETLVQANGYPTFSIDVGPATMSQVSISSDGRGLIFYVGNASTSFPVFNLTVTVETILGQIKQDHIQYTVVAS